jgi:pimeloyl-ACP methyl ester carboxylesterase
VAGEHTLTTADGRTLVVTESGDPAGRPVLMHHGTPASGLLYAPHEALARQQGIRLLGYDRAGYGRSSRHAGRGVADCAADVHAIADALELERFACWGISGGGPHVLACAALCDERCAAVASLAAVAPYEADGLDWYEGMGQENWDEFGAALAGEGPLRAFLEPIREHHLHIGPEEIVSIFETLAGPEDRSVLTGEFAAWVADSGKRGLEHGMDGWVDDDLAFTEPWGFELESIDRPVLLLHGADDRFVPVSHGRWLAERIPGVEVRIDASDGHLTLLERRMRETHEWLLAQL